tara:strand:+ start:82 stop:669 length:588 start_codon:yes stop_codon:yes gene_type:complete
MTDLITLAEYKEAQKITGASDDARLTTLVGSVSQLVKTYCNNTFVDHYSTNKVEYFNNNFTTTSVQLTESPVNSIVSVKERSGIASDYTTLSSSKDYYLDYNTDSVFRSNGSNGYIPFPRGPGAVEVTYTAGYVTCPADLKLAVISLVTYYHKDEHKGRQSLAGASIQNQSSSTQRDNVAFPDHIKRVLDLYKNY